MVMSQTPLKMKILTLIFNGPEDNPTNKRHNKLFVFMQYFYACVICMLQSKMFATGVCMILKLKIIICIAL